MRKHRSLNRLLLILTCLTILSQSLAPASVVAEPWDSARAPSGELIDPVLHLSAKEPSLQPAARRAPQVAEIKELWPAVALLFPAQALQDQPPQRLATTCTVRNANDSGAGSLRACLGAAAASDKVLFDPAVFPPKEPKTIALSSPLLAISVDDLTIDASVAGVILDGSNLQGTTIGLAIRNAKGVMIRGLGILNFSVGVALWQSSQCTIGGDRSVGTGLTGQGNLISANRLMGIGMGGEGTTGNLIAGNLIGMDATGRVIQANLVGIQLDQGANDNSIGGTHPAGVCRGLCNLISGNDAGIALQGGASRNQIIGNFIGTDISGASAKGNKLGIFITHGAANNILGGARTPGSCDRSCNLISGNREDGIKVQIAGTVGNRILGNYVGTNASGSAAIPNNDGVSIGTGASDTQIGGSASGEGNLISGNNNMGVWISWLETARNQVIGNYVGTDATGKIAIPNYHGVFVSQSTGNQIGSETDGGGNLISGNEFAGIWLEHLVAPGNIVEGNKIGTDVTGTKSLANYRGILITTACNNRIGGSSAGAGNLISGNSTVGVKIELTSTQNSLVGNRVGTNANGDVAVANQNEGVHIGFGASRNTVGGGVPGEGNLISGNGLSGIMIQNADTVGNRVLGNRIGTNTTGLGALPNGGNGVTVIAARETIVGGTHTPWVCTGPLQLGRRQQECGHWHSRRIHRIKLSDAG